jgi:hypothetical protein
MDRLKLIKKIAEKQKAEKRVFAAAIVALDERKALIKEQKKLQKTIPAAERVTKSSLDCFSEENMYYSEKDTGRFLDGHPIMDAYNENKRLDSWD